MVQVMISICYSNILFVIFCFFFLIVMFLKEKE